MNILYCETGKIQNWYTKMTSNIEIPKIRLEKCLQYFGYQHVVSIEIPNVYKVTCHFSNWSRASPKVSPVDLPTNKINDRRRGHLYFHMEVS